jgi:hypothetical protein
MSPARAVALASLPMKMQIPSAGSRCHYSPAQIKPQEREVVVSASTALLVRHAPLHQRVALSVVAERSAKKRQPGSRPIAGITCFCL